MNASLLVAIQFGTSLIFLLSAISVATAGDLSPYEPKNDSVVLERLPTIPYSRDQLVAVRKELTRNPKNVQLAATAASSYINVAKSTGDPRFLGYARAAIEGWWDDPDPPATILEFRAKLKERDHDFKGAIGDLQLFSKKEPENAQALVDLANIYRVIGDYEQANEAVEQLSAFGTEFQTAVCRIPIMAVTGFAHEAYDLTGAQLPFARQSIPDSVSWLLVMQADLARILGDFDLADRHYQECLKDSPSNRYARRAYGEFLLKRGRAKEALKMLGEPDSDNGALVLATIAASRSGRTSLAENWKFMVERRFEELRLRGGKPHGRFESQFLLEIHGVPEEALAVALTTWSHQKEATDSYNVLAAALAAGDADAAIPVIDFLRESGTEDSELLTLVKRLRK